jgi:hypothetical protein
VVRQPQQLLRRRLHRPAGAARADTDTECNAIGIADANTIGSAGHAHANTIGSAGDAHAHA